MGTETVINMICKKHNKEYNQFLSACPECMKEGKPLSTEQINYILSFMDKSTDYCTSADDYKFDEELKKKLVQMIPGEIE